MWKSWWEGGGTKVSRLPHSPGCQPWWNQPAIQRPECTMHHLVWQPNHHQHHDLSSLQHSYTLVLQALERNKMCKRHEAQFNSLVVICFKQMHRTAPKEVNGHRWSTTTSIQCILYIRTQWNQHQLTYTSHNIPGWPWRTSSLLWIMLAKWSFAKVSISKRVKYIFNNNWAK